MIDRDDSQSLSRREFLKQAGVFSLGMLSLGLSGWFSTAGALASGGQPTQRLVVIMLRGAVDGLSVVVPYAEPNYYLSRPQIAVPKPGESLGALNLDGRFGLNPSMEALMPFWQRQSLAFVHASGSPDGSRSHFDAQDFMETGTPGDKHTDTGWMNRLMGVLPNLHSPTQAVSFTAVMPKIMRGKQTIASMSIGRKSEQAMAIDRPQISAVFDKLYGGNDALSLAYREGISSRHSLMESLSQEMVMANNGAPSVNGFSDSARKLAQAMVKDPTIQLVFTDLGGWDTHVNQGSTQGSLANKLRALADGVAELLNGLQPVYPDTTVVVMSEFGRTVHENGDSGTDHGHGNVMWVAGGSIRGGKVYGAWPGLAPEALFEQRDLAVTTDFRSVIASILMTRFRLSQSQLASVFPAFSPSFNSINGLIRA